MLYFIPYPLVNGKHVCGCWFFFCKRVGTPTKKYHQKRKKKTQKNITKNGDKQTLWMEQNEMFHILKHIWNSERTSLKICWMLVVSNSPGPSNSLPTWMAMETGRDARQVLREGGHWDRFFRLKMCEMRDVKVEIGKFGWGFLLETFWDRKPGHEGNESHEEHEVRKLQKALRTLLGWFGSRS